MSLLRTMGGKVRLQKLSHEGPLLMICGVAMVHASEQSLMLVWYMQTLCWYIGLTGDAPFTLLLDLPSFSCMEVGPCLQNCHPEGLLCSGLVQR